MAEASPWPSARIGADPPSPARVPALAGGGRFGTARSPRCRACGSRHGQEQTHSFLYPARDDGDDDHQQGFLRRRGSPEADGRARVPAYAHRPHDVRRLVGLLGPVSEPCPCFRVLLATTSTTSLEPQASDRTDPLVRSRTPMRADETSWPYNDPGGDEPDWATGDGHPSWPANGNGQDWTAGDDSWPATAMARTGRPATTAGPATATATGTGRTGRTVRTIPAGPPVASARTGRPATTAGPALATAAPPCHTVRTTPAARPATARTGRVPVAGPPRHGGNRRPQRTRPPRADGAATAGAGGVRVPASGGPGRRAQRSGPRGGGGPGPGAAVLRGRFR